MQLKPADLLTQISGLKKALDSFSVESLSVSEAKELKSLFDSFQDKAHARIWGETISETQNTSNPTDEMDLLARISHDIRTPLNGIIGFADLLGETVLNSHQTEYVNAIQHASTHLLDFINQFLEYSRNNGQAQVLDTQKFNPKKLLERIAYLYRTLIVKDKVRLDFVLHGELPDQLTGDVTKLSQILMNVLGNAVKFVDQGRIGLTVSPLKENNTCWLQFEISDTGKGIPKEKLPELFEPFNQLNNSNGQRDSRGVGLGLSIVKDLINQLKGTIQVKSEPGVGSCFYIKIPFEIDQTNESEQQNSSEQATVELDGVRIIVFEDNELNQKLISTRLEAWGCEVTMVKNPLEGLLLLQHNPFDIILMDLMMPGLSGYEATRRIRESHSEELQNIPVIAVTADYSLKDLESARKLGITDILLKPFASEELQQILAKNLPEERTQHSSHFQSTNLEEPFVKADHTDLKVDLSEMFKECLGEIDLLEELVGLLKNNLLEFTGKMRLHLENKDHKGVQFAAHKVKAGVVLVGCDPMLERIKQLHDLGTNKAAFHEINASYNSYLALQGRFDQELDRALESIKNSGA